MLATAAGLSSAGRRSLVSGLQGCVRAWTLVALRYQQGASSRELGPLSPRRLLFPRRAPTASGALAQSMDGEPRMCPSFIYLYFERPKTILVLHTVVSQW